MLACLAQTKSTLVSHVVDSLTRRMEEDSPGGVADETRKAVLAHLLDAVAPLNLRLGDARGVAVGGPNGDNADSAQRANSTSFKKLTGHSSSIKGGLAVKCGFGPPRVDGSAWTTVHGCRVSLTVKQRAYLPAAGAGADVAAHLDSLHAAGAARAGSTDVFFRLFTFYL